MFTRGKGMSQALMNIVAAIVIIATLVLGVYLIIRATKSIRALMAKYSEHKSKHTYMTLVVTLLLHLVLITTYGNIVITSSLRWYGTPATNFVSLLNLILVIPYNILLGFICGYIHKKDIIVASISGVILTMAFILIVGSTGVGMLLGTW